MDLFGLDRQQIIAIILVILMIGSSVVYTLAFAFG
jgi:hypothetical protein